MREHNVRSAEDALAYITDCTLATVADMASKKSRPKGEYKRQMMIAQKGCDWMQHMDISSKGTRAEDIINKQTVKEWASRFEPKVA